MQKFQLLEKRLSSTETTRSPGQNNEILNSAKINSKGENVHESKLKNYSSPDAKASKTNVFRAASPFQEKNVNSELILIDLGSDDSSLKQSNEEKSNECDGANKSMLKRSADLEEGVISIKSPKITAGDVHKSPKKYGDENETSSVIQDSGSRGSDGKCTMRTIESYFPPQTDYNTSTAISTNIASFNQSENNNESTINSKKYDSMIQSTSLSSSKSTTTNSFVGSSKTLNSSSTATAIHSNKTFNQSITNNNINNFNEMKKNYESMKVSREQAESKVSRLEADLKVAQDRIKSLEERNTKLCRSLEEVYRENSIQEARRKRDRLALDCVRLGKITTMRTGPTSVQDMWEEGYALKDITRRSLEHLERKEELERRKKKLQTLKRQAKKTQSGDDEDDVELELWAEADAVRSHMEQLKKDEAAWAEERRLLDSEKAVHQRELKRCGSEERSRFAKDLPLLHSRYQLLSLLGRGGFSEVWRALDLAELREVAVKVHQLNPQWTEDRKSSYIKHVTREYTIHRDLQHPRVVQFFDVFEIDINSFATVLEHCRGIDLDERLKRCRTIPEKDARVVLLQILSGLKYLSAPGSSEEDPTDGEQRGGGRKAIIHFDLKPANILFDEIGDVKITDFGLSKIIDESHDGTSMELTSQGAGTYWYLPPECFQRGDLETGIGAPRISGKVDIWSLGVIFYQMLYGRRPYGEGKSQERVLSEGLILNATQVEFPTSSDTKGSKVSDEAKDFIRACLTPDPRYRPDVNALCQHAYIRTGNTR